MTSAQPQAATSTHTPPATSTSGGTSPPSGADNASSSSSTATQAAAFQIPGKKISVLPIGLGIFAGISVIALIVVGLVTYERTKYRKVCCIQLLLDRVTLLTSNNYRYSGSENWLSRAQIWATAA